MAAALVMLIAGTVAKPAKADTTETLAYTFALTLAGTVGGAYLFPYAVPVVAPSVAGTYAATAATVDGALASVFAPPYFPAAVASGYAASASALNSVITTAGSYVVLEPRMVGSITGMTAGLVGGLYVFSEPVEEKIEIAEDTTNTVVTLRR